MRKLKGRLDLFEFEYDRIGSVSFVIITIINIDPVMKGRVVLQCLRRILDGINL